MLLIPGVIASSRLAISGAYESIASSTLGSNASSIDFNSIPSTYASLQIRFRAIASTTSQDLSVGMNGSFSIANSAFHRVYGDGSTASAAGLSGQNFLPVLSGLTTANDDVYCGIIDIHDYASTTKTKTFRFVIGNDRNGSGTIQLSSGFFNTTSAITSVNFFNGFNWKTGTTFALYGIKGA